MSFVRKIFRKKNNKRILVRLLRNARTRYVRRLTSRNLNRSLDRFTVRTDDVLSIILRTPGLHSVARGVLSVPCTRLRSRRIVGRPSVGVTCPSSPLSRYLICKISRQRKQRRTTSTRANWTAPPPQSTRERILTCAPTYVGVCSARIGFDEGWRSHRRRQGAANIVFAFTASLPKLP